MAAPNTSKWITLRRAAVFLVCALTVFTCGIALGVYYHNEITVVTKGVFAQSSEQYPEPEDLPPVDPEEDTYINLSAIEQELPLVYSDTLEEPIIQEYLKEGAVVLPLGTTFGEPGNVVVTAHSSGTEGFGPYRFAFAKLSELEEGDEYTIHTPTATYTYRVYGKEVVWPHEVDKLPSDDRPTVTLVTCWPLWTNFKRLLVHTELTGIEYRI